MKFKKLLDKYRDRSFFLRGPESVRLCRLAVSLAWRAHPALVGTTLLLLIVQAALAPLQLWFSQAIVDRLTFDLGLTLQVTGLTALLPLVAWVALAAAAIALSQFLQPLSSTLDAMAGDRITGFLSVELMRATNRWQGLARFEDPQTADDLDHARMYIEEGGGLEIMSYGTRTVLALFTVIGMVLLLATLHPLVPMLLVLLTLPALAQRWDFGDRMNSHLYVQTPESRRLQYIRAMTVIPGPAKDVRLYGLGPFFARRYAAVFQRTMGILDRCAGCWCPASRLPVCSRRSRSAACGSGWHGASISETRRSAPSCSMAAAACCFTDSCSAWDSTWVFSRSRWVRYARTSASWMPRLTYPSRTGPSRRRAPYDRASSSRTSASPIPAAIRRF